MNPGPGLESYVSGEFEDGFLLINVQESYLFTTFGGSQSFLLYVNKSELFRNIWMCRGVLSDVEKSERESKS